jgi:hypothetical protein
VKPPLKGSQPRRTVAFDITAEQYQMLIDLQAASTSMGHVSISKLARDAFELGLAGTK